MHRLLIEGIFNRCISAAHLVYKRCLSPILGENCRFHPPCSDYVAAALTKYGPLKGGLLSAKRVVKCQPFCAGGFDEVP